MELIKARKVLRVAWEAVRRGQPDAPELAELKEEAEEEKGEGRTNAWRVLDALARGNRHPADPANPGNANPQSEQQQPQQQPAQPQPQEQQPPQPAQQPNQPPPAAAAAVVNDPIQATRLMEEAQAKIFVIKKQQKLLNQLRDASVDPLLAGGIAYTLMFDYETKARKDARYLFDQELKQPGLNPYAIMLFNSQFAETKEGRSYYEFNADRDISLQSLAKVIIFGTQSLRRKFKRTWFNIVEEVVRRNGNLTVQHLLPETAVSLSEEYLYFMVKDNEYKERNPFLPAGYTESIARYQESAYISLKERLRNEKIWNREAAICILTVESLLKESSALATYQLKYKTADFVTAQLAFQFAMNLNDRVTFYRFWLLASVCKYMLCCSGLVPMNLLTNGVQEDVDVLTVAAALFG